MLSISLSLSRTQVPGLRGSNQYRRNNLKGNYGPLEDTGRFLSLRESVFLSRIGTTLAEGSWLAFNLHPSIGATGLRECVRRSSGCPEATGVHRRYHRYSATRELRSPARPRFYVRARGWMWGRACQLHDRVGIRECDECTYMGLQGRARA